MNYKNFLFTIILGLLSNIGIVFCDDTDIQNKIIYHPLTRQEMDKIQQDLYDKYPYPHEIRYSFKKIKEFRLKNGKTLDYCALTKVRIKSTKPNSSIKPITFCFPKAIDQANFFKMRSEFYSPIKSEIQKHSVEKFVKVNVARE